MNVFGFLVSFVLFLGGIYMLGSAFSIEEHQALLFSGGVLVSCIGVALPIHLYKRISN